MADSPTAAVAGLLAEFPVGTPEPVARPLADADVERRLAELDGLLARVEEIPGPAGELALEAVAALAEIYGAALTRAVGYLTGAAGHSTPVDAFTADPLLGHLLVLHGIHPDPVEVRVERTLAEVREQLGAHGGDVALAGIADGVAEVRVTPGGGCGSPDPGEVEEVVRGTVLAAAPELADVRVVPVRATTFVPLDSLSRAPVGMPR